MKTVTLQELEAVFPTAKRGKVVLTGGCFDILHIGHIRFLQEAKEGGDFLVVLLENDVTVKRLKGEKRPVFAQHERAEMLSALETVDLVVLLPPMEKDGDYSSLMMRIKPDVVAVTENDPLMEKKKRQLEKIGGGLRVVPLVRTFSTSRLARMLEVD